MSIFKPCKYKVGDEVDMRDWDSSERPVNRMGRCVVISIKRGVCESGHLVTVRSLRGDMAEMTVDQNWLKPLP